MIPLQNKPNTKAPDGVDTFGALKDDSGSGDGTPVDKQVYNDIHVFFESLMLWAGLAANNQPDNATNGFQLLDAFKAGVRNVTATELLRGAAEIATQTETNTGSDDSRIVTPLKLAGWFSNMFGAWTLRSNVADVTVNGGTGISVTASSIKYKVTGKTMNVLFRIVVDNTTAPTEFEILIPASKTYNGGINLSLGGAIVFDGSTFKQSRIELQTSANTKMKVNLLAGDTLTNATTTTVTGQLTFEIA